MKSAIAQQTSFLHIEDDEVDAILFRKTFSKNGLKNQVISAQDGEEALQILNNDEEFDGSKPFLIFLDLNMPRMGGIQFLEALRKDPKLRSSIVFVLTTSENHRDMQKCYELNVAGYLLKGFGATCSLDDHAKMIDRYLTSVEFSNISK